MSTLIAAALACLRPGAVQSEKQEKRYEMESYLRSHPKDREVTIVLARLCRADNDLGSGIAVLDSFLKAKADAKESDKDYADALYNRACYKLQLWRDIGDVQYKDQAYEDLRKSIAISPTNKVDAQGDEDFEPLWEEERFKTLGTAEEQKKATLPR